MIHDLRIDQNYLSNLVSGLKKAEIRINDRDYQRGDILRFKDYSETKVKEYLFEVTHIHSGLGLERLYVVLSVRAV